MNKYIFLSFLLGCGGKSTDSGALEDEGFQWPPGAVAPRVVGGYAYCDSGNQIIFVNVTGDDPQGVIDITRDENFFRIYPVGSNTHMVEDYLYCDHGECVYSFQPWHYPEINCENYKGYRFTAVVVDWDGNSSPEVDIQVGSLPSN